jgi:hypothetical protein
MVKLKINPRQGSSRVSSLGFVFCGPLDLFSEYYLRILLLLSFSFLLLFSLFISVEKWIINFMKQPASISELCVDKAFRPMPCSNLMLVFFEQVSNRKSGFKAH